jgi:DivIVA domain-containing protein
MASSRSLTGNDVRQAVFAKPPLGKRGYDARQVDEFMAKVAATLDGQGSVTADEMHNVIFRPAGLRDRGYREDEVDAMLDLAASILRRRREGGLPADPAAATARSEPISGYHLRQTAIKKLLPGHGYDMPSVDAFVDRAANALDGFGSPITPDEVHNVAFPPVKRWQRGYDEVEVDALLERIVAELGRRSAGW